MQILLKIPNPPKRQDIIDIPLHFINGTVCEAGGYGFQVLPPHGRLIDADVLQGKAFDDNFKYKISERDLYVVNVYIEHAPVIIEAEGEE